MEEKLIQNSDILNDNLKTDINYDLVELSDNDKKYLRKIRKQFEQKILKMELKLKEKIDVSAKIEKDNKELKQKLFEKDNLLKNKNNQLELSIKNINLLTIQVNSLKDNLSISDKEKLALETNKIHKKYKKLSNSNKHLLQVKFDMSKKVKKLTNELEINSSLGYNSSKDELISLNLSLKNAKSELESYKIKYFKLEKEYLKLKISNSDLEISYDNILQNKKTEVENQPIIIMENIIDYLGYFTDRNGKLEFCNLNNEYYLINDYSSYIPPNTPGKIRVINNIAYVLEVYKEKESINHNNKIYESKTKVNNKKPNIKYIQFGNFTVLIIGSRFKNTYINRLKEHGVNAIWHDPYAESYERLKEKFNTADIVIICTSHTNHSAIYSINKLDKKVEEIEKDNIVNIIARVRFKALQFGLLNEQKII